MSGTRLHCVSTTNLVNASGGILCLGTGPGRNVYVLYHQIIMYLV
jgi:hypothetical protein